MIIDIHAHTMVSSYREDKKNIILACEKYGFDRVYISTLGEFYPTSEEIDSYNKITYDFMKENSGLVRGFVTVDPVYDNYIDVLKKGIFEYGMEGAKIWVSLLCDDPKNNALAEHCIDYNIPVLIHAFHKSVGQLPFETTGINVRNLALRYPELKIIMAHLGGNVYHTLRCVEDLKNVYTDISGTLCGNDDIPYAIECLGEERILFGTDMPVSAHHTIGQIEGSYLTKEQKDKIYFQNSLRILERNL